MGYHDDQTFILVTMITKLAPRKWYGLPKPPLLIDYHGHHILTVCHDHQTDRLPWPPDIGKLPWSPDWQMLPWVTDWQVYHSHHWYRLPWIPLWCRLAWLQDFDTVTMAIRHTKFPWASNFDTGYYYHQFDTGYHGQKILIWLPWLSNVALTCKYTYFCIM